MLLSGLPLTQLICLLSSSENEGMKGGGGELVGIFNQILCFESTMMFRQLHVTLDQKATLLFRPFLFIYVNVIQSFI